MYSLPYLQRWPVSEHYASLAAFQLNCTYPVYIITLLCVVFIWNIIHWTLQALHPTTNYLRSVKGSRDPVFQVSSFGETLKANNNTVLQVHFSTTHSALQASQRPLVRILELAVVWQYWEERKQGRNRSTLWDGSAYSSNIISLAWNF